jgi:hypothetical protein
MILKGVGNWVKEKLNSLKANEKAKAPKQHASMRRYRMRPLWVRNALCATAHCMARGRTLNPHAVARATHWRLEHLHELDAKIKAGTATPKEQREQRRISG